MTTLHITNGDSAVDLLKAAAIEGDYLPWRDILHMGPVPWKSDMTQLSEVRAGYIADTGWGEKATVLADFRRRDALLSKVNDYDKVTLWFEHDLYDQLQILQLLDYLGQHASSHPDLGLINPNKYIGYHTPEEAVDLLATREPISANQFALAAKAWRAFCQNTPDHWAALLQEDVSALPHLHDAILRGCEELPDSKSGISKTEQHILDLIEKGHTSRGALFRAYCAKEEAQFHGDWSFFWLLDQLIQDTPPLVIEFSEQLRLTDTGHRVMLGRERWAREFTASQWFGGYQLNKEAQWYWCAEDQSFTKAQDAS